ncbi:MAG: A/G-specific adenine glycosylase [Pseudomonadota bacterium]
MKKSIPSQIRNNLLQWYWKNDRNLPWRQTKDPYRVWISEVMLQQTRIEAVIPYFMRFIERFPDLKSLAESDLQSVLKLWEGLGYYARARNMHKAAKIICDQYQGRLPETRDELLLLPGVGEYISAAVASISFHIPVSVIDGNVKRILARLFTDPTPVNDTTAKRHFEGHAEKLLDRENPGDYNQAVMELGQMICKPRNPVCMDCPIQLYCEAFRKNRIPQYPQKISKKSIPLKQMIYAMILKDGKYLLLKRPANGLLGGLWEIPGGELHQKARLKKQLADMVLNRTGIRIEVKRKVGTFSHAYTHFKIDAIVYLCGCKSGEICLNGPAEHRWILPEEIPHYPCHKLIHKMVPLLHEAAAKWGCAL